MIKGLGVFVKSARWCTTGFLILICSGAFFTPKSEAQISYPNSPISCGTGTTLYFYGVWDGANGRYASSYRIQILKGSTNLSNGAFEYRSVFKQTVAGTGNGYEGFVAPCAGWGSSKMKVKISGFNSAGQLIVAPTYSEIKFGGSVDIKAPPRSITSRPGQVVNIQNAFEPGESPVTNPSPNGSLSSANFDPSVKPKRHAFDKNKFNQCVRMRIRAYKAKHRNLRLAKKSRFLKRQETMRRCKELSTDSSLTPVQIAHASLCDGLFCMSVYSVVPIGVDMACKTGLEAAFNVDTGHLSWNVPNNCRGYTYHLTFEGVNLATGLYDAEWSELRATNAAGVPPAPLDHGLGGEIDPTDIESSPASGYAGYAVDNNRNQEWAYDGPRSPQYSLTMKLSADNSRVFNVKELRVSTGEAQSGPPGSGTGLAALYPMKILAKVWYSDSISRPTAWTNFAVVQTYLELEGGGTVPAELDTSSSYLVPVTAAGIAARWVKFEFGDNNATGAPSVPFINEIDFFGEEVAGGVTPPAGTAIANCAQLQALNNPRGEYFLNQDIDCSSISNFTPITATGGRFILNGNNKTISGLNILSTTINQPVGLFRVVSDDVTIRDLSVHATVSGASKAGILIGETWVSAVNPTIENVDVHGSVAGAVGVGGLIGYAEAVNRVVGGASSAVVTAQRTAGGLIGNLREGEVSDSFATGSVSPVSGVSGPSIFGGLIGHLNQFGFIRRSFSSATVSGLGELGGLVGNMNSCDGCSQPIGIQDSFASGNVRHLSGSDSFIGGLVGKGFERTVERVYSSGLVSGGFNVGGLFGSINRTTIYDSFTMSPIVDLNASSANDSTINAMAGSGAFRGSAFWIVASLGAGRQCSNTTVTGGHSCVPVSIVSGTMLPSWSSSVWDLSPLIAQNAPALR